MSTPPPAGAVTPKPGDKVRVTFEATVTQLDDHKRVAYVDDGNDKWRAYIPVNATVDVLERADDPSQDPRGLVREFKAGVPAVCYGRDYWVYFAAGSGAGYGIAKDREVIGCRVIGSVPGTPAAEADQLAVGVMPEPGPRQPLKSRPPFPYQIRDWQDQEARVECFSGRDASHVVHEGTIIGYTEAPTARVQKDDGQIVSWVIGLIRRAQSDIDALPDWELELLEQEAARRRAPRVFQSDGPEPQEDVTVLHDPASRSGYMAYLIRTPSGWRWSPSKELIEPDAGASASWETVARAAVGELVEVLS